MCIIGRWHRGGSGILAIGLMPDPYSHVTTTIQRDAAARSDVAFKKYVKMSGDGVR
jgi:hypothetical protein